MSLNENDDWKDPSTEESYEWLKIPVVAKYGDKIGTELFAAFVKSIEKYKYDNCDNFRYASENSTSDMEQYQRQIEKGCCGFYDEKIVINGEVFHFGFNYGH